AAVLLVGDDALALQRSKGFTQGASGNAEALRELDLPDLLPREQRAVDDEATYLCGSLEGELGRAVDHGLRHGRAPSLSRRSAAAGLSCPSGKVTSRQAVSHVVQTAIQDTHHQGPARDPAPVVCSVRSATAALGERCPSPRES